MNQELNQQVEREAREQLDKGRFQGTLKIKEINKKPNFAGQIDARHLHDIKIEYNPEFEEKNPGKTVRVVKDIARHEVNHNCFYGFNGCPRTLENHVESIFEPISEVLFEKGYTKHDVHYIANALEDTILHADLSKGFSLDGIKEFFKDVAENIEGKKFTPYFEAHTKLNLYLWGNKKQKKELQKYFTHDKKVKEVLQNFLKETGIADLEGRMEMRDFLNDKENWKKISKIYAKEFSKLMQPGYAMPMFDNSGEGTKGKEKSKEDSDEPEGNQFDREMESPEYQEVRVKKAYTEDSGVPKWIDTFKALDLLYQNIAKKLKIKVETFTQQSSMPIHRYGIRSFDPEKDDLKNVSFGFDDKGKLELKKKRYHEDIPLNYKVNPKGFPEIRFCLLDTSGSMAWDTNNGHNVGKTSVIPWGDQSKYHYALLGWYGLLEYLKQNHLLKQQSINLANFSSQTHMKQGLEESKRLALNPQFGGTKIDLDEIKYLFKNKGMLIFTISDGEIENWDGIKNDFIKYAKQHYYFHLQIGNENSITKEMKENGLYVECIKNAEDLSTKVINLTDNLYRGKK
ncbi:MAG: hypothetical protein PHD81_03060 [Candidatus Nanoarchaeia archaeon]|nr:hypothetical protein [Candidatus Nanoarchaeia archaeon]MDD5588064.1 hypothetical protein [Candidatus Nanoarchaeia archaeon]